MHGSLTLQDPADRARREQEAADKQRQQREAEEAHQRADPAGGGKVIHQNPGGRAVL